MKASRSDQRSDIHGLASQLPSLKQTLPQKKYSLKNILQGSLPPKPKQPMAESLNQSSHPRAQNSKNLLISEYLSVASNASSNHTTSMNTLTSKHFIQQHAISPLKTDDTLPQPLNWKRKVLHQSLDRKIYLSPDKGNRESGQDDPLAALGLGQSPHESNEVELGQNKKQKGHRKKAASVYNVFDDATQDKKIHAIKEESSDQPRNSKSSSLCDLNQPKKTKALHHKDNTENSLSDCEILVYGLNKSQKQVSPKHKLATEGDLRTQFSQNDLPQMPVDKLQAAMAVQHKLRAENKLLKAQVDYYKTSRCT